jgi:hypothetical protein
LHCDLISTNDLRQIAKPAVYFRACGGLFRSSLGVLLPTLG